MNKLLTEIKEELTSVVSNQTLDTLLPPILFLLFNTLFNLVVGIAFAITSALIVTLIRLVKKQKLIYALAGLVSVLIASGFALIANKSSNYFLPGLIGTGAIFLMMVISLIAKKPFAAWLSHITRGWDLQWFWRKDVRPAYSEVTILWAIYFALRFIIQWIFLMNNDTVKLLWMNTLLELPMTIGILTTSYVYGIWRLHRLKGPGIDEFNSKKSPPWHGQKRGF